MNRIRVRVSLRWLIAAILLIWMASCGGVLDGITGSSKDLDPFVWGTSRWNDGHHYLPE